MSDFSPLSIFKSQAKQLARDQGLKLSAVQESLARNAGFADYHELSLVAERYPLDPRLMTAVFGVKDFGDAIYDNDVYAELEQKIDNQLASAAADTNAEGYAIDGLAVDTADYNLSTGMLSLALSFTYKGQHDHERAALGAAFFVTAMVKLLRRTGRWLLPAEGGIVIDYESDEDRVEGLGTRRGQAIPSSPRTSDYVVLKGVQRGVEFIGILEAKLSATNPLGLDLQCFVHGYGGVYGLPFPLWFISEFKGDMIEEALTADGVNWVGSVEEIRSFETVNRASISDKIQLLYFTLENCRCSKLAADLDELLNAQALA